jgi:hypothetical protein
MRTNILKLFLSETTKPFDIFVLLAEIFIK